MKLNTLRKVHHLNANGFTLLGVLMVLVLICVLGGSILLVTSNSLKLSENERIDQSTFYIAEAGIVVTRKDIEDKLQQAYEDAYRDTKRYYDSLTNEKKIEFNFVAELEKNYLTQVTNLPKTWTVKSNSEGDSFKFDFETNYSEDNVGIIPVVAVYVTREGLDYMMESIGKIGNKERTVSQKLIVKLDVGNLGELGTPGIPGTPGTPGQGGGLIEGLPLDTAIMVRNEVKIKSSTVTGNIATLKPGAKSITIDWGVPTINGSFYVPSGSETTALTQPAYMGFSPKVNGAKMGSMPTLPSFPTPPTYKSLSDIISPGDGATSLKLQNNSSIGNIKVSGSHVLTLDIGDTDKELVLNNLEISGAAQIVIKGTGKFTLHVKNNFYVTGSGKFNVLSSNKNTEIFYSGNEVLGKNFGGGAEIYASIYAKTANVDISSSTKVHGNILSGGGSFIVRGEGKVGPSLYFAPNAHFEVRNSGKVTGTIIGNSISMEGEGLVKFGEPQYNTWIPGTPSTPSIPGTPPSQAPNPDLTKREPLVEI
ncbi:hypothetical protein [Psychrobacillus sp. NPDC096389]|uniref:DUF7305 domain-containing protein n=1 Tax=Psychrobacillus sp. NPDC096389 TaxID=3364490 RepID=UPI0037F85945